MLILSQHGSSGYFHGLWTPLFPPPYCIAATTQLCTCIGHNIQYAERGKGSMKESWLKRTHSIPGHSPEIRVDLWNSSARGNEMVCRRQDLGESFKSHWGMTRSLSFAFSLSMPTTLSPRLIPCLCCSSQRREGTNPFLSQGPLLDDDVKMCLAVSCGDNYEHYPCSQRYERIYGMPMLRHLGFGKLKTGLEWRTLQNRHKTTSVWLWSSRMLMVSHLCKTSFYEHVKSVLICVQMQSHRQEHFPCCHAPNCPWQYFLLTFL